MFLETIDKGIEAGFFTRKALYNIFSISKNKFCNLDEVKTVIYNYIKGMEHIDINYCNSYYMDKILSIKKILNKKYFDSYKREYINKCFCSCMQFECNRIDMINKFDNQIKIVEQYLNLDEYSYHEEMNDELIRILYF